MKNKKETKSPQEKIPLGKEGECEWPQKCECWDCVNYHPYFSPMIKEGKK